ncbi:MAG: histidinol-phosphate transaminase [Paracoccaceae bacterium]
MTSPNPHVATMAPYALAELTVAPGVQLISLSQNESLRAPSPLAIQAAVRAFENTAEYPDPDWTDLCEAISQVLGLSMDSILCGAGSMELINAIVRAYAGPGDHVLAPEYTYAFFRTMAQVAQADYRTAAETDLTVSVQALLAAVEPQTRIVCVANPGNPTGTSIPAADLRFLRAQLPTDVLLIVDEAYGEFIPKSKPLFDLVEQGSTIILRTFSKAYGLAGMRVGWGCFPPEIAAQTRKLLNPNNISAASQAAATAAMLDQDYMRDTCTRTIALRESFTRSCRALGLKVPDSHTNFILIQFASSATAKSADRYLRQHGILMRGMGGYGLPDCLRATIGPVQIMDTTIKCLKHWQAKET